MSSDDRTIYVGNLAPKAEEDVIYELVQHAGPIERLVFKRPERGYPFAFVTFVHEESPGYAVALLKGVELYGRALSVQDKSEEPNTKFEKMLADYFRENPRQTPERGHHDRRRNEPWEYHNRSSQSPRGMPPPNYPPPMMNAYPSRNKPFDREDILRGRPYQAGGPDYGQPYDHRHHRGPDQRSGRYSDPMPMRYEYDDGDYHRRGGHRSDRKRSEYDGDDGYDGRSHHREEKRRRHY